MLQCGIHHIRDLIDQYHLNVFLTNDKFFERYGQCVTWLDFYSLLSAIPATWHFFFNDSECNESCSIMSSYDKLKISTQSISGQVYCKYVSNLRLMLKTCNKWSNELQYDLEYETFLGYFINTAYNYCTIASKLRYFCKE